MTATDKLAYPLVSEPGCGDGSAVEISPGLLWLRMPLSGPLGFINVWAVLEENGWAIIDTGVYSSATVQAWQLALQRSLHGRPISRVFATHMHPDHCGMAGWIAQQFGAPLWMSRLEYLMCRVLAADTGRPAPAEGLLFYRQAGYDDAAMERYREKFGFFGSAISALPASFRRLSDGDFLRVGEHEWSVVIGRGHSPEHACLYCPELKLLISGDQVLPRISSNVSVHPTEPDSNPLDDWLTTLAQIKQRVPDDVLVLCAHNSPFIGLHSRIDALIESHRMGLQRLLQQLEEPQRAVDVFPSLFRRPITPELMSMATGEAMAHLNYLLHQREISKTEGTHRVWWWNRSHA